MAPIDPQCYAEPMRLLITNDDGVHAPGLAVLERIAARFTDDVWVVAPETEMSGASRALTLTAPVRVRRLETKRFAVSGTPTDCVLLGVLELLDGRPDYVLSGVNRGQNIGEHVSLSGTIAGALQGMAMGIPAVAFSQARGFRGVDAIAWETAEAYGPGVLRRLIEEGWPADVIMNVNFPDRAPEDVREIEVTTQGFRDQAIAHADRRTDLRGETYYWIGFKGALSSPPDGTDLRAIYEGRISVTPLHLDLTHEHARAALRGKLGGAPPKA
jgi:5'-nucleotidase